MMPGTTRSDGTVGSLGPYDDDESRFLESMQKLQSSVQMHHTARVTLREHVTQNFEVGRQFKSMAESAAVFLNGHAPYYPYITGPSTAPGCR